jgi:hypothetical protein
VAQQRTGSLRGHVSDELGALVVGATVMLIAADGTQKTTATNIEGTYNFNSLPPGQYTLRVVSPGFTQYEKTELTIAAGPRTTHDVRLVITLEKQVITVNEEQGLNTDPQNNADAVVLRGQDLDVLPDDPDALASAVQAMADPSAGPNGGRVRNINAPLPGTYDPEHPESAVRPLGNIGDVYYYESSAKFNDYRVFGGLRRQMSKGFSMFANFGGGSGKTDTDCIFGSIANCFPADSYDVSNEYSRVSFIPKGNFFFGGTFIVPKLKVSLNPFIVYSMGRAFNTLTVMGCSPNDLHLQPRKPIRKT